MKKMFFENFLVWRDVPGRPSVESKKSNGGEKSGDVLKVLNDQREGVIDDVTQGIIDEGEQQGERIRSREKSNKDADLVLEESRRDWWRSSEIKMEKLDPDLNAGALRRLAKDAGLSTAIAIMVHKNYDVEVQEIFLSHPNSVIRAFALRTNFMGKSVINRSISHERIEKFYGDPSQVVKEQVLPLAIFARMPVERVRSFLNQRLGDPDSKVRERLAKLLTTTPYSPSYENEIRIFALKKLAIDSNEDVRAAVVGSGRGVQDPEIHKILAKDKSVRIRAKLARCTRCYGAVKILADDVDEGVRVSISKRVGIFVDSSDYGESLMASRIAKKLANDLSEKVRVNLALNTSDLELLSYLINDESDGVKAAVVERSAQLANPRMGGAF